MKGVFCNERFIEKEIVMGIRLFGSSCKDVSHSSCKCAPSVRTEYVYVREDSRNPNPDRFSIKNTKQVGRFLVASIQYPNCKNFEGDKILVFENVTERDLRTLRSLDPHFCDSSGHISPTARFVPTQKGWQYALTFCENA